MADSNLGRAVLQIVADAKEFYAELQKAEGAGQSLGNSFTKLGADLKSFGNQANKLGRDLTASVSIPIAAVGAAGIKAFSDFDRAMTESLAIMGSSGQAMRGEMEATAKSVAINVGVSSTDAAKAYYFLASAGLDVKQSIAALPAVAEFARAGVFNLEQATTFLVDAQTALGLTSKDANVNLREMVRVSDVLNKANIIANGSTQQFSEALTNMAAGALKQTNKEIEEGVAVLAAFASVGVKGKEAGEKLAIVLRDLQTANIKYRGAWVNYGLSVYDANGKMRNMGDIISDITKKLGPMSSEQRRTTLMLLGFQDRSVQAIQALLGLGGSIKDYEKQLRSAGGATKEISDLQRTSFAAAMQRVTEVVTQAGQALGSALAPSIKNLASALEPVLQTITSALTAFGKLPQPVKDVVVTFAALAAALGPLLVVVGSVASAIGGLLPVIALLGPALVGLSGVIATLATTVAPVVAVGGVFFLFTKFLMDNTEWGRALAGVLGDLINKVKGVDTKAMEQGVDVTKRWTAEERAIVAEFNKKQAALRAVKDAAVDTETAPAPARKATIVDMQNIVAALEARQREGASLSKAEQQQLKQYRAALQEAENAIKQISAAQVTLFGSSNLSAQEAAATFNNLKAAIAAAGATIQTMTSSQLLAYEAELTKLLPLSSAWPALNQQIDTTLQNVSLQLLNLGYNTGGLTSVQLPGLNAALQTEQGWFSAINTELGTLSMTSVPGASTALQGLATSSMTSSASIVVSINQNAVTFGQMVQTILGGVVQMSGSLAGLGGAWQSWGGLVAGVASSVTGCISRIAAAQQQYGKDSQMTGKMTTDAYLDMGIGVGNAMQSMGSKYKSVAIAGAIISALLASVKALASSSPPMNYVLAALTLAAGMATVYKIKSAPAYAEGTPNLDFAGFGKETSVLLHRQEAVIPRGKGHLLAGEIASAMPGQADAATTALLERVADALDRMPYTMGTAFRNGALLGTA